MPHTLISALKNTTHSLDAQQSQAMLTLMPRYLRQLETWLLMFCGFYGLLVSRAVTHSTQLLVLCAGFLALGLLRWLSPAVTARHWVLGAFATLGLAAVIYLHPASGGISGPYLFLLILMAMAYPMAMSEATALGFGGVLLAVYFGSAWLKPSAIRPELVLARAVLLTGICTLSALFGRNLRRSQWLFESLLRDTKSGVFNEQGLNFYGQRMIDRASAKGQPIALALLRVPNGWLPAEMNSRWDLLIAAKHSDEPSEDAQDQRERNTANRMLTRALQDMAQQLIAAVGSRCLIARMRNGDWVLMAMNTTRKKLLNTLVSRFGHPLQVPFGQPKDDLFVPITPCVAEVDPANPHMEATLAYVYSLWQRSEHAGTVSLD
jgi:hypothetical protein